MTTAQTYEIWVQLLPGQTTIAAAADQPGVDRCSILKLRQVAKQGALDALAKSRPGVQAGAPDPELAAARARSPGASEALKETLVLMLIEAKRMLGSSGRLPLAGATRPPKPGCWS